MLVCTVLTYAGDHLLAPVLTGITVGFALRAVAIRSEVRDNDARVEELNADLGRWVRDRGKQLEEAIIRAGALADQGIIEDSVRAWEPPRLRRLRPGSQRHSGAFIVRVERLMRQALHEYRDQASRSVREYRRIARSEGWLHRMFRAELEPLYLPESARDAIATWRRRDVPAHGTPVAEVEDDPSRAPDAADIRPLETPAGLTSAAARGDTMPGDK